MHGLQEESHHAGMEMKLSHRELGLDGRRQPRRYGRKNTEALSGDFEPPTDEDVEVIELDLAIEAGPESLDDAAFENRSSTMKNISPMVKRTTAESSAVMPIRFQMRRARCVIYLTVPTPAMRQTI
jgi:hypothetical protein